MISLILASSLLASIPTAIEKTDQDNPVYLEMLAKHEQEIAALKVRIAAAEYTQEFVQTCWSRSFLGAGIDLGSTALGLATRDDLEEKNPFGFNVEARIAMKVTQAGIAGWGCQKLAKDGHSTGAKIASWSSFIIQAAAASWNLIQTYRNR